MVYTREMAQPAYPGPGDPGVIAALLNHSVAGSSAPSTVALKVPWDNVRLVYGYTAVTTALNSKGSLVLTVTDGTTTLESGTIAASAAVGTVADLTEATSRSANIARDNLTNASTLTLSWYGAASATGQVMVYLYFEPAGCGTDG
ncbi:MAG: hypothetical protein ACXABD_14655 [Candidatus Thorarchaeota archaeon]|jgi:hypothetical protein